MIALDLHDVLAKPSILAERKRSLEMMIGRKVEQSVNIEGESKMRQNRKSVSHRRRRNLTQLNADLWRKRVDFNFRFHVPELSKEEFEQLKYLRYFLGAQTQSVIECMTIPRNWSHFTQRIQQMDQRIRVPLVPQIEFLYRHRVNLLVIMIEYFSNLQSSYEESTYLSDLRSIRSREADCNLRAFLDGDLEITSKIRASKSYPELLGALIED